MTLEPWHYTARSHDEGRIGIRMPGTEHVLSRDDAEKLYRSLGAELSKQVIALDASRNQNSTDQCECHRCIKERGITEGGFPLNMVKMILCPECGNKRCPKASDHRLACTGSNDPGQPGSY